MPNLAQLLSTKSPVEHQQIFNLCRELSETIAQVESVYVVGGVVRDLILGREPGDADISVVGDAGAFSGALAGRLGLARPTESEFLTFKIILGNTSEGATSIDVVTARAETYAEPAALPDVVPSSIEDDLERRDFTVNSMGISLSDSDWGNLVDPVNGLGDIMRKRIRVLHDASFTDDPTRLFRAVRYAVRLDFSIESTTKSLIDDSLGKVDRLGGARLRNEFELMLGEPKRVEILREAEDLGLLAAISPGLRIGSRSLEVMESGAWTRLSG